MESSGLNYLLREGVRNIKANRQMSLASIGVLVACMLLIGAACLFSFNVNAIMGYIEGQNEVVIFVEDEAEQTIIDNLQQLLEEIENISSVYFMSREDGLLGLMEQIPDSAYLLDGLMEDNPLPPAYIVKLKSLEGLSQTVEELKELPGVLQISAPTEVAITLTDIKTGVSVGGLMIVSILVMVSIIIISNTIKVTIFNRRKEISIMKYVGATDAFIRLPFLVEGMIIGFTSAILSFGLLWIGYEYVMHWLQATPSSWLQLVHQNLVLFIDVAPLMLGGFVLAGTVFGIIGSLFFVGRYLKV